MLNLKPPRRLGPALAARLDGLWAVSADVRGLSSAFAGAVRRRGLPLLVYTCNSPANVKRALAAGSGGTERRSLYASEQHVGRQRIWRWPSAVVADRLGAKQLLLVA